MVFFLFVFSGDPDLPFFVRCRLRVPVFSVRTLCASFLNRIRPLSPLVLIELYYHSFFFFIAFSVVRATLGMYAPGGVRGVSASLFLTFCSNLWVVLFLRFGASFRSNDAFVTRF